MSSATPLRWCGRPSSVRTSPARSRRQVALVVDHQRLGAAGQQLSVGGVPRGALRSQAREDQIDGDVSLEPADGGRRFALLTRDISGEQTLADQLARARDTAARLGRMKSEFLANVSHELRTPLNAIVGMSFLLLEDPLTPEQHELVRHIDAAGQHLTGLIDDILDFSKLDSGQLELQVVAFSVPDLLGRVAAMVEQRAAVKGLTVRVEADGLPALLCGDPERLTQALLQYAVGSDVTLNVARGDQELTITVKLRERPRN